MLSYLLRGYCANASVIIHTTYEGWRCCFLFGDVNSRIGKDNDYCLFFEDLTIFLLKSKENVKSLEWLFFFMTNPTFLSLCWRRWKNTWGACFTTENLKIWKGGMRTVVNLDSLCSLLFLGITNVLFLKQAELHNLF